MNGFEMSSPEESQFSTVWSELSDRLRRVLYSRRVPADLVDDFVQETGLRLFRNWSSVDQTMLWAFANTILWNLVRDEVRKNEVRNRNASALVVEQTRDFDEEMQSRLELLRVKRVLSTLSEIDQQVLLTEWGEGTEPHFTSPGALKMARMRARRRLHAALQHSFGLVPAWRVLRLRFSESPSFWNVSEQLSQFAATGVLLLVGLVGPFGGRLPMEVTSPSHVGARFIGVGAEETLEVRGPSRDLNATTTSALASTTDGSGMASTQSKDAALAGGGSSAPRSQRRYDDADMDDADMNDNFGPVRAGDDGLHAGEGGNGLGPYGADRSIEASPGGRRIKARAKVKYEGPTCQGDIVVGGQSEPYECDPGSASAGVETGAEGQHHEASTSSG